MFLKRKKINKSKQKLTEINLEEPDFIDNINKDFKISTDDNKVEIHEPPTFDIIKKEIKIYTLPNCKYSQKLIEYFENENLKFEKIDLSVSEKGQSFMAKNAYKVVPITSINGHNIVGFNIEKIKSTLYNC